MNARPLAALVLLSFAAPSAATANPRLWLRCPDGTPAQLDADGVARCQNGDEGHAGLTPLKPKKQVRTGLIIEEHPYETGYHPMPQWFRALSVGIAQVDPGADSGAGAFAVSADVDSAGTLFESAYAGDLFGWAVTEADGGLFASAPGYGLITRYDDISASSYSIDDADASVYGSGMLGFELAASSSGLLASAPFDSAGGSVHLIEDAGAGWTSISTAASATIESTTAGAAFGYRLLVADVDADGDEDLIASAPGTGEVFVFLDLADLGELSTDDADAVLSGTAGSFAGYDVAAVAGDEGALAHLLIGAPGADTAYLVAAADVVLGGALDTVAETVLSGEAGSRFGHRVMDFGGDTVGVSSPDAGLIEALDATTGALVGVLEGDAEARFGAGVSLADLDGDGMLDIAAASLDGEDTALSGLLSSTRD